MNREQWVTLKQSYWPGVVKKLDELIQFEMIKLKNCKPHELTAIQQGLVQLEKLKNLPDDVIEAENFGQ